MQSFLINWLDGNRIRGHVTVEAPSEEEALETAYRTLNQMTTFRPVVVGPADSDPVVGSARSYLRRDRAMRKACVGISTELLEKLPPGALAELVNSMSDH